MLALPLAGLSCGPTEVLVGDAPGVARVVAGVLGRAYDGEADSIAVDARSVPLGAPAGVAASVDGSFYFADRGRRRIGHVTAEGLLSWPVGRGRCGLPGPDGADPRRVCLVDPAGVALGADGSVAFTDMRGHAVYRYDPAADRLERLLGTGTAGMGADGALASGAPTAAPADVARGPDDAWYVVETLNHRIVQLGPDGRLHVVAGSGVPGDAGDGGPAAAARLAQPEGLAWHGDTLYLSDSGNHRIRRVTDGIIEAYAGVGAAGFAGDGGPAGAALFRRPGRMAVTGTLLLVADREDHRVRIIRLGPDTVGTFGGTGVAAVGADLQTIGLTPLLGPSAVASVGRAVFIADSGGFVVRRVIR